MELFQKIVNGFQLLIIFAKSSILDTWLVSENTSVLVKLSRKKALDNVVFACINIPPTFAWNLTVSGIFINFSEKTWNMIENNVSVKCEEDPKSVKHYKFTAQKMKFSIKISPVNVTDLRKLLIGKLDFLCSGFI